MIREIHIFDIDGTLVDSSHRYRSKWNGNKLTIDLNHWLENAHLHYKDTPLPLADSFAELLQRKDVYTIWCTARTTNQFVAAFDNLISMLGRPHKFFCRPNNCMESGAILKARQLKSFLNLKQFQGAKKFFYEDNKSYLDNVCAVIDAVPVYVESNQGH
jgi:hypothetical protein